MWFIARLLLGLSVAVAVGFGTSYYALTDGRMISAVRSGPWAAWPDVGQPSPDPYSRAFLARSGKMQLGYAEGIQFSAYEDDLGEPLASVCTYRISGMVPGASFWTLEAADLDGANIAQTADLMVLQSERIARRDDGAIDIAVGPNFVSGNWLPIEPGGAFELHLTLYDALIFSGGNNAIKQMPSIKRVTCQ